MQPVTIWTIGHSTRDIGVFVEMLKASGIRAVADVRRFPASRRYPQYNGATLAASLATHGIEYHGMTTLGGRRSPRPDSRNTAWRNRSFRGYADYMETPAFAYAVDELTALAKRCSTTVMCAEALWWQCHRALIADYLMARGDTVLHIRDVDRVDPHRYSAAANVVNGVLRYGATQLELGGS